MSFSLFIWPPSWNNSIYNFYWAGMNRKGNIIISRWRPNKKRKGHLSPRGPRPISIICHLPNPLVSHWSLPLMGIINYSLRYTACTKGKGAGRLQSMPGMPNSSREAVLESKPASKTPPQQMLYTRSGVSRDSWRQKPAVFSPEPNCV